MTEESVRLVLFGTPRAAGAEDVAGLPAKALAAVALLALEYDNFSSRGALSARLWEGEDAGSSGSLRTLLYLVHRWERTTGLTLLRHDTVNIWRDADCVPSDLDQFLTIARIGDAEQLDRFVDMYRGELLDGLDQTVEAELGEAIAAHRRILAGRFAALALPAAERLRGPAAERAARRVLQDTPYDERALRLLMALLGEAGATDTARREYGLFVERLTAELGLRPEAETLAAFARLTGAPPIAAASPMEQLLNVPTPETPGPTGGKPRVLILPPGPSPYRIGRRQQLLAASFIDDVTLTLCKQRTFAVIAPHSARQLASGSTEGDRHDADYVLTTRLLPAGGDALRMGLSFVRAATGEVLIGEDISFSADDLPTRHREIAETVAGRLAGTIARSEIATYRRTGAATAYVHYLLGQERMRVIELADLRRARKAFRRAQELQADFSPAISMEARTLTLEWLILGRLERDMLAEAHRLALRAVEINPFEAAGHRELGHVALYMQDYEHSLDLIDHARSLSPHHADILMNEADVLVHNSRPAEARPLCELAMALNPLAPDDYFWISATVDFFTGHYREALSRFGRMKNPEPAARLAAACAAMAGDDAAARRYRLKSMARHPDFRLADWQKLIGLKSETDKALYVEALRRAGFD